jgi:Ca2+/Na+ antiporter
MKQVFRTTFKYRAMQEGAVLLIQILVVIFLFWIKVYWLGLLWGFFVLLLFINLLKLQRNYVEIDEHEIMSFDNQKEIRIRWSEVIAARFEKWTNASTFLILWTTDQEAVLPIHQFDYKEIMRLAEQFILPSAFEESAVHKTPAHKKYLAEEAKKIAELQLPLPVSDRWIIKVTGWTLLLFCLPAVFALLVYQEILLAIVSLIFAVLGIIFTVNSGSLEVDREKLIRKTLLGRYQMRWDEVKWIEHHEEDSGWLLCGENKQLGIISPFWCSSKDREQYMVLVMSEIHQRKIEMKRDWRVLFKSSKNTRMN